MSFPLRKTGLIVDINNLYFAIQAKFGKRKLQIVDYVKWLEDRGHVLTYKIAYSRQRADEAPGFVSLLKANGFETHFSNTQWSVAMALRTADIVANIDCLVLGTNYQEAGRILAWAKERGKLTKCFAANIAPFFKQLCDCVEIPEEILSEVVDPTKPVELPANVGGDAPRSGT